jgi:pimeloyl-ACP methyl ester carboxylesterase
MAIISYTQRLISPRPDAPYTVQMVTLPPVGAAPSAARLDSAPAEHSAKRQRDACPPATWLQPKDWNGTAVLLIPGASDNRHAFKWLLFEHLLARRLAVLTLDPPGHGDFRAVPCTLENARRTAQKALDWLCAQAGVRRVGAIGISFGGCQAADLAARDSRVAALALVSTPVRLPPVTRWTVVRELLSLLYLPANLILLRLPLLLAEWHSIPSAWFGESLYEMIARFDVLSAVRAIGNRPKLIVHGTHDMAVPPVNAQQIYDAALPERALLWVPRTNHIGMALRAGAMRALAGWLADHLL